MASGNGPRAPGQEPRQPAGEEPADGRRSPLGRAAQAFGEMRAGTPRRDRRFEARRRRCSASSSRTSGIRPTRCISAGRNPAASLERRSIPRRSLSRRTLGTSGASTTTTNCASRGAGPGAGEKPQSGPRQERTLTMSTQMILGWLWSLLGWKGAVLLAGAAGLGAFILFKGRSTVAVAAAVLAGLGVLWYAWPSSAKSSTGSAGMHTETAKDPSPTKTAKKSHGSRADMAGRGMGSMGFMPGMGAQNGMPSATFGGHSAAEDADARSRGSARRFPCVVRVRWRNAYDDHRISCGGRCAASGSCGQCRGAGRPLCHGEIANTGNIAGIALVETGCDRRKHARD